MQHDHKNHLERINREHEDLKSEMESQRKEPKGKGGPRKAPAKKGKPVSVDTDEDEEILGLKDRFAAHNLDDSSTDKVMESENDVAPAKKKVVRKQSPATPKKGISEISSDDADDEQMKTISEEASDEEFEPAAAGPAGRKGKAPTKPAATSKVANPGITKRKRGPAKKHTLITDTLKPAENVGIPPEKKVIKMRESPFNKKSSSIMGRIGERSSSGEKSSTINEEELNSSDEVVAPVRRPVRATRNASKYVLSDSDEPADDESGFDASVDIDSDEDE